MGWFGLNPKGYEVGWFSLGEVEFVAVGWIRNGLVSQPLAGLGGDQGIRIMFGVGGLLGLVVEWISKLGRGRGVGILNLGGVTGGICKR